MAARVPYNESDECVPVPARARMRNPNFNRMDDSVNNQEKEKEAAEFFAVRKARADLEAFDRIMKRRGGEAPRAGDEIKE